MAKILIATEKPFAAKAVEGIRNVIEEAGFELVLCEKYTEKQQLLDAVADVDAMIVRSDKVDADVVAAAKNLKIVVRAGAGFDNLDLEALSARKIVAMNTPGQNANAVAELVLGMMVYAVRNFYNGTSGTELMGKKLGILAFGNVGRNVARIAQGFGMQILAYDAFCSDEGIRASNAEVAHSPQQLFEECDFVSLHIPCTEETRQSINYGLISKMKKNAILINSARKEVINEADLIKAMTERTDIKYIADVAPEAASEFSSRFPGRYFATPKKMGAQTAEANINAGIAAANQIVNFLKNGVTRFQVNKF